MAVKTLETDDAYTIEYDDDIDGVVFRWDRFVQGDAFRDGCEQLLRTIESHGAAKLLIDSRQLNVVSDEDIEWMFEDWVPRSAEAGVRYTATVYEESTIAKMNMDKIAGYVEESQASGAAGDAHMTTEVAEARSWLQEQ